MQRLAALPQKYPRTLALFAGGVSATGFAPLNLWFLTLLCLALLMHLVGSAETGKRAFLIGWLFGIGHFTIGNNWIATAFTYQTAMPASLGWIAVVALALYLAVYPALAAWGAWWLAKRVGRPMANYPVSWAFVFAFAGLWIITEWLRSWVFTGFAWNPLAAIRVDRHEQNFGDYLGSYGASGIIILLNVGIYFLGFQWAAMREAKNPRNPDRDPADADNIGIPAILIIFMLVAWTFIYYVALRPVGPDLGFDKEPKLGAPITIVQPNVSQIDKYRPGYEALNFSRLAQNSRPKDNRPRLLLWPESAIPWWLEDGYPPQAYWQQPGGSAAETRVTLAQLLGPGDVLLTGADRLEYGADGKLAGARNAVLAIDAKGTVKGHYDKAHLVPYGEYLALRWLLEPLGAARLVPGSIDFLPGPGPQTMTVEVGGQPVKIGMQICYEIIFSGQVVDRANRPDFIFNPSNDAWFGGWGSPQFLAQSRLRAIEEGLPVVRATPTGISAVIDADGRVLETLGRGKTGRIDAMVPVSKAPTLFSRYGNILPLGFAALLIALALLPLARRRLSR